MALQAQRERAGLEPQIDGVDSGIADRLEFGRKLVSNREESGRGQRLEDNRADPKVEGGVGDGKIGLNDTSCQLQRADQIGRIAGVEGGDKSAQVVEPDHAHQRRIRRGRLCRGRRDEVSDLARKVDILIEHRFDRFPHSGRERGDGR